MEQEMNGNGAVYVPFGDDKSDVLSLEHASRMLRLFKKRQPALFGAYLAEAYVGTAPKAAPKKRGE